MAYNPPAPAGIPGGGNPAPTQIGFGDPRPFGSTGVQSALLDNIGFHHGVGAPWNPSPMPPGGRGDIETFANTITPSAHSNLPIEMLDTKGRFDTLGVEGGVDPFKEGDPVWQIRAPDNELASFGPVNWSRSSAKYGTTYQAPSRIYYSTQQLNARLRLWQLYKLTMRAREHLNDLVRNPGLPAPTVYETLGGGARGIKKYVQFELLGALHARTLRGTGRSEPNAKGQVFDANVALRGIMNLRNYYAMAYTGGANVDYAFLPFKKNWKEACPKDPEYSWAIAFNARQQTASITGGAQVSSNLAHASRSSNTQKQQIPFDYSVIEKVFGRDFVLYQIIPIVVDDPAFSLCEPHPIIDYLTCDSDDPAPKPREGTPARPVTPVEVLTWRIHPDLCAFHMGRVHLPYKWQDNDRLTPAQVVGYGYSGKDAIWTALTTSATVDDDALSRLTQKYFTRFTRHLLLAGAISFAVSRDAKHVHTRIALDMSCTTARQYAKFNLLSS